MGNSTYPGKYDTAENLPRVRNNIVEIGPDAINSLRSAVIRIEQTLGLNPQGAAGNTVSSRISNALDDLGNIKKEALAAISVLSGPIYNSDVSSEAAILESKLKLDFPTQVLQTEISELQNDLNNIINTIEELQSRFAIHINSSSANRHKASSISLETKISEPSDLSTLNIESDNVQSFAEDIYNKHINYTGNEITDVNNSHLAKQIFFDNSNVSDLIESPDVQGAIEDAVNNIYEQTKVHQEFFHTNALLKKANISTSLKFDTGRITDANISVSYDSNQGQDSALTILQLTNPIAISGFFTSKFDIAEIDDNGTIKRFLIQSVDTDFTDVISVTIYGVLQNSATDVNVNFYKNNKIESILHSLSLTALERPSSTNRDIVQIFNSNSAFILSKQIKPLQIFQSTTLDLTYTNKSSNPEYSRTISLDAFDSSVGVTQSLDRIIKIFNEQLTDNNFPAKAYRVDNTSYQSELLIALDTPDDNIEQFSISVGGPAVDDLGFTDYGSAEIYSLYGSSYVINGVKYGGIKTKLDSRDLSFLSSSSTVSGSNFLQLGLKIGDVLIVTSSEAEDGSYIITNIDDSNITVDAVFSGTSADNARFRVFESTISLLDLAFESVDESFGSALIEIFLDNDRKVFYNKKLEYAATLSGLDSLFSVTQCESYSKNSTYSLSIRNDGDNILASIDGSIEQILSGYDTTLDIITGNGSAKFTLSVSSCPDLYDYIDLNSDITTNLYTFEDVNKNGFLKVGEILYEAFNSSIAGNGNLARARTSVDKGSVGIDSIADSAIYSLSERPIDELRANGVISGLEVSVVIDGDDFYNVSVTGGIAYINGKRFEVPEIVSYNSHILSTGAGSVDNIFIGLDRYGDILINKGDEAACVSTVSSSSGIILATAEFGSSILTTYDMRLFVDELDLKILNSIKVSNVKGMGHFNSIPKALQYAKRFSKIYPQAGIPKIEVKAGHYIIEHNFDYTSYPSYANWKSKLASVNQNEILTPFYDELIKSGIFIDFPVIITGEGSSTIVEVKWHGSFASGVKRNFVGPIPICSEVFQIPSATFNGLKYEGGSNGISGDVTIKDITFVNTRIEIIDVGSGPYRGYSKVYLDGLHFDFQDMPINTLNQRKAIKFITTAFDVTGSVYCNNTKFTDCYIGISYDDNILLHSNSLQPYIYDVNFSNINAKIINSSNDFLFDEVIYSNGTGSGRAINVSGLSTFGLTSIVDQTKIISSTSPGNSSVGADIGSGLNVFSSDIVVSNNSRVYAKDFVFNIPETIRATSIYQISTSTLSNASLGAISTASLMNAVIDGSAHQRQLIRLTRGDLLASCRVAIPKINANYVKLLYVDVWLHVAGGATADILSCTLFNEDMSTTAIYTEGPHDMIFEDVCPSTASVTKYRFTPTRERFLQFDGDNLYTLYFNRAVCAEDTDILSINIVYEVETASQLL